MVGIHLLHHPQRCRRKVTATNRFLSEVGSSLHCNLVSNGCTCPPTTCSGCGDPLCSAHQDKWWNGCLMVITPPDDWLWSNTSRYDVLFLDDVSFTLRPTSESISETHKTLGTRMPSPTHHPQGASKDTSATRKMKLNENPNQPILLSRLRGQKYPPPIPTLGNLEHFLAKPFERPQTATIQLPESSLPVPGPLDPTKRDGLLSYAYSLYDTFVTGESPAGPDGPASAHAPMLLPLLELLHGLDPNHLQSALLLGCVYHRQGLYQRALDVNRELLERYPKNVC